LIVFCTQLFLLLRSFPFFKPDLHITLVDSLRPTDEEHYYPGEINVRMADLILVTKVKRNDPTEIQKANEHAKHLQKIIKLDTPVLFGSSIVKPGLGMTTLEAKHLVHGKKVLVIDDGPTLTHGGMPFGAGYVLAQDLGAGEIVDPRPYAQGSLIAVFEKFQHLRNVLPAMGYGESQVHDLEATIKATPCDAIVIGTPSDISHVINFDNRPTVTAQYDLEVLPQHLDQFEVALDSVYERYEKHHPIVA
jgi:predicted GTPase